MKTTPFWRAVRASWALKHRVIPRNVRGCWNIGYCGMGCPTGAKQSMLVTTLPSALAKGATLVSRLRAERLLLDGKQRVVALRGLALQADGIRSGNIEVTIRARHFIVAGGAIGSPALLMRSGVPDPHGLLGQRTFLHPTVVSAGVFKDRVDGYAGAPQSIYYPTISCISTRSTARWASSWRRRPCIRFCMRRPCRDLAKVTPRK